jgi:hypothetical protein
MHSNANSIKNDTAVLILSHIWDKGVKSHYKDIKASCENKYDVFFLGDNTRGVFNKYQKDHGFYLFTVDQLKRLGYPGKGKIEYDKLPEKHAGYHKNRNFVMGNTELPLLLFFKDQPEYKYYWLIEYDVRFSGSWHELFLYFRSSPSDLLATSLINYSEVKDWFRWQSLDFCGKKVDRNEYVKGFFPIFRISNRALQRMDKDYRSGVTGHYECLMPTLLNHAGLLLEDIGGDGKYSKPENNNRFYTNTPQNDSHAPGTFVFTPQMNWPGQKSNTLWHPVKYKPIWRVVLSRIKQYILKLSTISSRK